MPIPRNSSGIRSVSTGDSHPGGHLSGDPPGRDTASPGGLRSPRVSARKGTHIEVHQPAGVGTWHWHRGRRREGSPPQRRRSPPPGPTPRGRKGAASGCYAPAIFDRWRPGKGAQNNREIFSGNEQKDPCFGHCASLSYLARVRLLRDLRIDSKKKGYSGDAWNIGVRRYGAALPGGRVADPDVYCSLL